MRRQIVSGTVWMREWMHGAEQEGELCLTTIPSDLAYTCVEKLQKRRQQPKNVL